MFSGLPSGLCYKSGISRRGYSRFAGEYRCAASAGLSGAIKYWHGIPLARDAVGTVWCGYLVVSDEQNVSFGFGFEKYSLGIDYVYARYRSV